MPEEGLLPFARACGRIAQGMIDADIAQRANRETEELEHRIAFTLRPAACAFADVRLYVLITESACVRPWLETAEAATKYVFLAMR